MKRRVHDPAVSAWAYNLMLEALRARMPAAGASGAGPCASPPPRAPARRRAGSASSGAAQQPRPAVSAPAPARTSRDAPQLAQSWPDDGGERGGER